MTADWARLPYEVLSAISRRVIGEVEGINRVLYDVSSKLPRLSSGNEVIGSHPLLQDLNPNQQEAVTIAGVPVMVVAGAGSGKTRVLTHRIAYLIRGDGSTARLHPGYNLHQQGRPEMRGRVGELLGATVNNMWVSTFHSACARILRREAHCLRLSLYVLHLRPLRLGCVSSGSVSMNWVWTPVGSPLGGS